MDIRENKHYNTKDYFLVYGALIQAARCRGVLTYKDIAKIMGLPLSGNHMGRETGWMIGVISQNEVENGRPMLSAIVVSNVTYKPQPGFYDWARDLGRFTGRTVEEQLVFWEAEKQAVYDTWADDFATYKPRERKRYD